MRTRNILRIIILTAIALASFLMTHPESAHAGTDYTWSIGSDVVTPQYNNVDIRPAMLTDTGGYFWQVYSDGNNVVHRWRCTSLDSCTEQSTGALDSSFSTNYGERYWLGSGYTDLTTWYLTVHVEYSYHSTPAQNFHWFRKIGLATSTDHGLTWHYANDIIFTGQSSNINDFSAYRYFCDGPGDQYLYADWAHGYFYLYYTINWVDKNTAERWQSTRVARSPISSHMTSGSWIKYYNGSWSQPGTGGLDSDVFLNQDNAFVTYSSYLGRYVAIGHDTFRHAFIATATDLSTQNWTTRYSFSSDETRIRWYNWGADDTTADPYTIGQNLRLYSSQNGYNNVATKYIIVTFGQGQSNPDQQPSLQYQYPYQSLPDGNSGWQRSPNEPYGWLINGDFELEQGLPSGWIQWPYQWDSRAAIHIVSNGQRSGSYALTENATSIGQTIEQPVSLYPSTTYRFCAYARSIDGSPVYVGAKSFGGNEVNTPIATSYYSQGCVQFTTSGNSWGGTLYLWHPYGGTVYIDNATLTAI